jgi:ABC-2 type transport system permease protein
MFLDFRMVAMLVVPLVTMRLLAEERKLGTLELLWTFPVRDREATATDRRQRQVTEQIP